MKYPAYPTYKPSGVQWLGDVPEHWEVDRLKWSTAGVINGIWGDDADGVDDIICVRVADFDRDRFLVSDEPLTMRAVECGQRTNRLLHKGDLLIEKSGGGEKQLVGCVVFFSHDFDAVCSNFVARMPVASGHHARFWSYAHAALYAGRLNYPAVKQTTGIQNLDSATYLDTQVGYPQPDEQRAIADVLDAQTAKIDTLVAKKRELIEKLKEKRAALISRTVTRGLPPEAARAAGLEPNPRLKPSGVEWIGDVPEHWEVKPLGYLARFLGGATPDKGTAEYWDGDIPWVSPIDMKRPRIWDVPDHISLEGLRNSPLSIVPPGAVLIVVRGMILAHSFPVALAEAELTINQDMKALFSSKHITPSFLFWSLSGFSGAIVSLADESAHGTRKLGTSTLAKFPMFVPPLPDQDAIVAFLEAETGKIDEMSAKVEAAIERLQEYRTALITAAVTGKIDVRGALREGTTENTEHTEMGQGDVEGRGL